MWRCARLRFDSLAESLMGASAWERVSPDAGAYVSPLRSAFHFFAREEGVPPTSAIGHSFDLDQPNMDGESCIWDAVASGSVILLDLLLAHGCNPFADDARGRSSRDYAVQVLEADPSNEAAAKLIATFDGAA